MKSSCRRCLRLLLLSSLAVLVAAVLLLAVAEGWTRSHSSSYCSPAVEDCAQGSVGLVLGCSKYIRRGKESPYFFGRMEAAEALWKSGRVRCLIVSGDNRHLSYNEPRDMKNELVARGVPAERIVCDYAGLRTYDSVVRANRVFGADSLTIVSQPEHAARAVAIARSLGIEARGCEASMPRRLDWRSTLRQALRERMARIAMLADILLGHDPKYLGAPIPLPQ